MSHLIVFFTIVLKSMQIKKKQKALPAENYDVIASDYDVIASDYDVMSFRVKSWDY